MLSGVETTKEKVLRIILAGQPELNHKLDAPELVQLAQRIRLRFHLGTLSATEMQAYIHHRLEVAGAGDRQIFAEATYPEIYRFTGGVPRLVNTLCDTALLSAFAMNRDHVTMEDINTSVQELRWHEPQARPSAPGRVTPAAPPPNRENRESRDSLTDTHRVIRDGQPGGTASAAQADGAGGEPVGRIIVATEGRTTQELPLRVGRVIMGRTSDNDLQVDSRFVSRHHCQIITSAEGSVIEDLNSTNGIFVQGKRVRRYNLNDGDVVVIGKHEMMYVDERLARARMGTADTGTGVPTLDGVPDERVHADTTVLDDDERTHYEQPTSGRAANRFK